MAKLLSEQFRENIKNSDVRDDLTAGLYDAVKGMSDEDFKEYMYSSRKYFKENMPMAVDKIEGFQQYISEEPSWGAQNIDYDKVTGSENSLDNFYDYDMKDFEYFGSKVGMTGKEFMKQMAKDKTALDRKRIAHGEDAGGWFDSPTAFAHNLGGAVMNVFAPRSQEAIERGEEPSAKDIALDVVVDAAQALPVGKIAKVPAASKMFGIRNVLTNAAVPAAAEVADAVAYGDENPRGDLDPIDIAKGTAVNIIMPRGLRKYGAESWDDIGKTVTTKNIPFVGKVFSRGMEAGPSDILTNKTGDVLYQNRSTPLPIVGPMLDKTQKEKKVKKEKEQKKKEAKEKSESVTRKYLLGE